MHLDDLLEEFKDDSPPGGKKQSGGWTAKAGPTADDSWGSPAKPVLKASNTYGAGGNNYGVSSTKPAAGSIRNKNDGDDLDDLLDDMGAGSVGTPASSNTYQYQIPVNQQMQSAP